VVGEVFKNENVLIFVVLDQCTYPFWREPSVDGERVCLARRAIFCHRPIWPDQSHVRERLFQDKRSTDCIPTNEDQVEVPVTHLVDGQAIDINKLSERCLAADVLADSFACEHYSSQLPDPLPRQ
jgi:hypothetical protein